MITRRHFEASILACSFLGGFATGNQRFAGGQSTELDTQRIVADGKDLDIVFCVLDLGTGRMATVNAARIDERHSPWSTFKIPNLLIALEAGVAGGLDHERRWDEKRRPAESHWPKAWHQDHTLRTAFRQSVPWYFQDMALEVGADRYREALSRFGYGNGEVRSASDDFWLGGSLEISVREQVGFLDRLVDHALGISARSYATLRDVSLITDKLDHTLRGKTGSGPIQRQTFEGPSEGWFVGWVERLGTPSAAFALYVRGRDFGSIRYARLDLARTLLVRSGHLPKTWQQS